MRKRQTLFLCLNQNSEKWNLKVWWKCFLGASPSHKPQQLSSTAPGMFRKGSSLTTTEVRSTLRSGWQHQHEPADLKTKKTSSIYQDARHQLNSFHLYKTVRPPSFHHSAPLVSFNILEFIKTGSAKLSVSVQHLFYQDFGTRAKSPSLTVQLSASYLIMVCISCELHPGLKCASQYCHELDVFHCKVQKKTSFM